MTTLLENMEYHDLTKMMVPSVTVDEYEARMGKNSDIVTLTFTIKSKQAGEDLCGWFERGYPYVLDAKVSDGEIAPHQYLVFVEMYRRRAVAERIIELLSDLKTLTNLDLNQWTVIVDDVELDPELEILKKKIISSPSEYRDKKDVETEKQLNEYRHRAGLTTQSVFDSSDPDIRNIKTIAGL